MSQESKQLFYFRYNLYYPVQMASKNEVRPPPNKPSKNIAEIFTAIYEQNAWGSRESASGLGSELRYTENLRAELPLLFEKFAIKSVLDAPCGDFNWMSKVVEDTGILYIGGDIVSQLIRDNRKKTGSGNASFIELDICGDPLPKVDLWICRDSLFHFPFNEIYLSLKNFAESEIGYLLTTTHVNHSNWPNNDVAMGGFRYIDLFSEPFCLPRDVRYRVDDYIAPFPPREMVLFDRNQIVGALPKMKSLIG